VPLAGAGLALAALTMVRLEYGWVVVALLVLAALNWAARRRSVSARRLVAVAAVAFAGCLPWLAYTYHLTGKPLYWGTSAGLSLFWMSPTLPGETGQWHAPAKVARTPRLSAYAPLFRELEALHPVESDRRLRALALENVRARPLEYARNLAANASRLVFSIPMRPRLPAFGVGVYVLFNSLLLAGVARAAAVLWRARRDLPPEVGPIALFAVLAIAVHLPPSASTRMFLPVVPALLWLVTQSFALRPPDASRVRRRLGVSAQAFRSRRAAWTS
jgi:4-amino-4-deoxy-L-arabinose transferase-like glycosyltransferase